MVGWVVPLRHVPAFSRNLVYTMREAFSLTMADMFVSSEPADAQRHCTTYERPERS